MISTVSRPLLSLTIPTYNRAHYLAESLEYLLPQVIDEHRIELLISDNASTDMTGSVVESFQARGLVVRYIRNITNLGSDGNFLQCFNEARGKYVCVMGDDDLLVPDSLRKIIKLLEHDEYDLVYLSSVSFSGEQRPTSMRDPLGRFAECIMDGKYFLARVNAQIGLISSNIVNKDRLLTFPHPPITTLIGTNLLQVGWLFPLIHLECRILYVWEKVVLYRSFNSGGWGICNIFGINLNYIAHQYFAHEPSLAEGLMNGVLLMWMPHQVLQMRLGRETSMEEEDIVSSLRPVFHRNWRFWAFVYPVAKAPLWSAALVYKISRMSVRSFRIAQVLLRHLFHRQNVLQP